MASPQALALTAVLVCGLALRLSLAPFHGFFGDVQDLADWGDILIQHFFSVYSVGSAPSPLHPVGPPPNYGPLEIWLSGGAVWIYRLIAGPVPDMDLSTAGALAALIKVPAILADLAIGLVLYRLAIERLSWQLAVGVAALWVLSPVGMLVSGAWGQVDLLPVPFVLLALWQAHRGQAAWAGALLGVAMLIKPQPLVFVVVPLVYLARWCGRGPALRAALAAAGVLVAAWLPYAGEINAYLGNVQQALSQRPLMTTNAWNLWWLVGVGDADPATRYAFGLSLGTLGWLLFAGCVAAAIAVVATRRDRDDLFLAAAVVGVAFFVVAPMQHERYMVQALPLILAAAIGAPLRVAWYVAGSVAAFANMYFLAIPSLGPAEMVGMWNLHAEYPARATAPFALVVVLLLASMLSRSLPGSRSALATA